MLQVVTLHLGRTAAFPDGSTSRGYEITAPLDERGYLDAAAWQDNRDLCRVRRFWTGEPDRHGWLVHRAGGAGGATWGIDYDDATRDDDETGFRLSSHRLVADEYVSIRDADGELSPFRVASVKARPGAGKHPAA
jgi:hypothetical protein